MLVKRYADAAPYDTPGHHGMVGLRLQGLEATPTETVWVGLSQFLPGGGADKQTSPVEKIYLVLDGRITVTTDDGEVELGPLDSCVIPAGDSRILENRTNVTVSMAVIMPVVPK